MCDDGGQRREQWLVRGVVQGVGFRPFVYGLALRLGLAGFVRNDGNGVTIEVEGGAAALEAFARALHNEAPPLARIESASHRPIALLGETAFVIAASQAAARRATLIAPDSATCDDCLRELFDPADRRYGYAFINCTNCGPRFTIVADVPYDRANTTMAGFVLCSRCQAEYDDPLNRRFHAQPNACPRCGPQLAWRRTPPALRVLEAERVLLQGLPETSTEPLVTAARALAGGAILAIKGLGGYHLACDARNEAAVACLRRRKQREAKPFALMVADLAAARSLCLVDEREAALLSAPRRPIVLLERRADAILPPDLAPGYATLGLMLPYTPLHHLLLQACATQFAAAGPPLLVMTSGNLRDEPIAYRDEEAFAHLAPIADGMLYHNRAILTRCDDTVTRMVGGAEQLLRRSRGYAPAPLTLQLEFPRPLLACGGHLKNTFCLARDHQAFLSHHIGDLENLETLSSFREGVAHYQRLFDLAPEAVAYDLHPEYLATKEALASDLPLKIGVQHHHAHIAGVMAEHGLGGPVIGVAADGTGYGLDGAIWGCEILLAELADFSRLGQLAYLPLPGGDQAIRQPWRVAASYLQQVYGPAFLELDLPFTRRLDRARWQLLARMIERGLNSPLTSSLGRLFDGVAALLGLRDEVLYEGQAAIELEALALAGAPPYPFALRPGTPFQIEVGPTIEAIVADLRGAVTAPLIAGRFHATVAEFLAAACRQARSASGIAVVALSGGVFQNRLLLTSLTSRLTSEGFTVYTNQRVPPNDGGLSLGQAAVAAARLDH